MFLFILVLLGFFDGLSGSQASWLMIKFALFYWVVELVLDITIGDRFRTWYKTTRLHGFLVGVLKKNFGDHRIP
ncbi:hypothetical protein HYV70_05145 [Candidatus Uhrbacteria bacterium]|nr:hypothetical protein [Candidatus Uhrbacteria bacterium]